jgi:cob(I)alamin adenosyltransferase
MRESSIKQIDTQQTSNTKLLQRLSTQEQLLLERDEALQKLQH